jgi:hypothetical protein
MTGERTVPIKFLHAMERQRPLCPDHRDKQSGKDCLACTIESLTSRLAAAEAENEKLRQQLKHLQDVRLLEAVKAAKGGLDE